MSSSTSSTIPTPRTPAQPAVLPPRNLCDKVKFAFFHCECNWAVMNGDRPPKKQFPFQRFQELTTFTVCNLTLVRIRCLMQADGITPITRNAYEALSEAERPETWGRRTRLTSAGELMKRAEVAGSARSSTGRTSLKLTGRARATNLGGRSKPTVLTGVLTIATGETPSCRPSFGQVQLCL